jgi:hypothetical protein
MRRRLVLPGTWRLIAGGYALVIRDIFQKL